MTAKHASTKSATKSAAKGARAMSTRTKLLASTVLIAGAAGAAGLGTFGSFTSTTSASESVTAGTVVVGLGANGVDNRLSVAATGVVPGDTISRVVKLNNTGNQNFAAVTLSTTASPTSLLDTDTTNGLQLLIQKCSTGWTEGGTAPAYTYSCTGTTSTVLASRAVVGANQTLNNLSSLTAGSSDNLLVQLSLPTSADNTFQGLTSTVNFSFTATQRAGTNR